jgi:uncharacterized membrane protein
MKFSKASIIISVLTFLIFGISIANLVLCLSTGQSVVMGIGIAVVMLGIFIACLVTAIKDAKKSASASDDDSDDIDDDDDYDDEDDED